jgi:hypothetical protein
MKTTTNGEIPILAKSNSHEKVTPNVRIPKSPYSYQKIVYNRILLRVRGVAKWKNGSSRLWRNMGI